MSWTNCIRGLAGRGAVGSATAATLLIGFFEILQMRNLYMNILGGAGKSNFYWPNSESKILVFWIPEIWWSGSQLHAYASLGSHPEKLSDKSSRRNIYCAKTFKPSTEVTSEKWTDKSLKRNIFDKTFIPETSLGEGWTLIFIRLLRRGEEMVWKKLTANRFEKRGEVADRIPVTFWLAVCCSR